MRIKIAVGLTVALVLVLAGVALAQPENSFAEADFVAELSGANEVPPVVTDTTGEARFILDGDVLRFELEIEDATEIFGVAGAHIHCAPAGENGGIVAFLAGAVPGGFDGTVEIKATLSDANILNHVDHLGNENACGESLEELIEAMEAGNTYVNAHSPDHPGGEIRGQIEAIDS